VEKMKGNNNYTRDINPLFGLAGLLGLIGPIGYILTKQNFILAFIAFIGFFGFVFEGKMSNKLKDESYFYNKTRADGISFKCAFCLSILALLIALNITNASIALTFLIGFISFIWGFTMILNSYLLYQSLR